MGQLWDCYGTDMGLIWACYGPAIGLLWGCYGAAMCLLWDFHGAAMGLPWGYYGHAMGLLWTCYGPAMVAVLKQATYGLQFANISEAGITDLMGKSRKVALHAAHVASTEPRDLTGAPRDLHGLGPTNWHTANTANKIAILTKC